MCNLKPIRVDSLYDLEEIINKRIRLMKSEEKIVTKAFDEIKDEKN